MSWNYRIVRHPASNGEEPHYSLREVFYDEAGNPRGMTSNPATFGGDEPHHIIQALQMAMDSCEKHGVLDDPWPE